MLLPCEDNCLRTIALDRPAMRVGRFDNLPCDIEQALLAVIEHELVLQRQLEGLKRDLECCYDFSSHAAFRAIDKSNTGTISNANLSSFLRAHGTYPLETELI